MLSLLNLLKSQAFLGWFLIALFYCYQYILRVMPGVIANELRDHFNLTAEDFASLGAYCLYAYALLQIPVGLVLDRIGVKRTILISMCLCIGGTFWISQTNTLWEAQMSRILVGAGSACTFTSCLKWVADHFEPGRRGLLMGSTLAFGTFGALGAAHPFVKGVELFGWQYTVLLTCFLGGFLLILTILFLKEAPLKNNETFQKKKFWFDLKTIACNKTIFIYALLAIGVYTPMAVLADLWGVSFLAEKFAINRAEAAPITMLMYVGLTFGSLILPVFAERYNVFRLILQVCSACLLFLFTIMLIAGSLPLLALKGMLITIGFLCGAEMICFTGAVTEATPRTSGLTLGFVNTMNMLAGALLQQLIGYLLDIQWNGATSVSGMRYYSANEYVQALMVLPAILLGCVVLSLFLKKPKTITSNR